MSCKNYKQYDSKWASKAYAGGTMRRSGCGPTAAASVIYHVNKSIDPTDTADWLSAHGYATNGWGTVWGGIEKVIDHYKMNCTMLNSSRLYGKTNTDAEKKWKKQMKTGKYFGILLMGPGNFTKGGHFITITSWDGTYANVYDPASASRTGKHKWADFAGDVKIFYLIKIPDVLYSRTFPTLPKKGYLSKGDTGTQVKYLQMFLNWYGGYGLVIDGSFGDKTLVAVKAFQKAAGLTVDGKFGPASLAKAKVVKR